MARKADWRLIGVASLTWAFFLVMNQGGAGQALGDDLSLIPVPSDAFYLAQQPTVAPEEESEAPPVAPPPAEPLVQPRPDEEPPAEPQPPRRPPRRTPSRSPIARLASIPNMYGDFFASSGQLVFCTNMYQGYEGEGNGYGICSAVDLPPLGGGGRVKISENNKALPMDRVFFMYNHYHNALDSADLFGPTGSSSVERYLIGAEKTFHCGCSSIEIRMPLTNTFGAPRTLGFTEADVEGGRVGNLSFVLKRLLWATNRSTAAVGLGLDTPTGSDVDGTIGAADFRLHNDAWHILPWVGFLRVPSERLFYQGFFQFDFATNENRVDFDSARLGELADQNLMYLDFSLGYWLYRNPCPGHFRGLASLVELHYATTIQDADVVSGSNGLGDSLQLGNVFNRIDILNLTAGLHAEICNSDVRVAGVFPLRLDSDKQFDAEIQVSVNRRF